MALTTKERGNFQRQINEIKTEVNKKAYKTEVPPAPEVTVPEPPASGTFVLTATDGVLSWEAQA